MVIHIFKLFLPNIVSQLLGMPDDCTVIAMHVVGQPSDEALRWSEL